MIASVITEMFERIVQEMGLRLAGIFMVFLAIKFLSMLLERWLHWNVLLERYRPVSDDKRDDLRRLRLTWWNNEAWTTTVDKHGNLRKRKAPNSGRRRRRRW